MGTSLRPILPGLFAPGSPCPAPCRWTRPVKRSSSVPVRPILSISGDLGWGKEDAPSGTGRGPWPDARSARLSSSLSPFASWERSTSPQKAQPCSRRTTEAPSTPSSSVWPRTSEGARSASSPRRSCSSGPCSGGRSAGWDRSPCAEGRAIRRPWIARSMCSGRAAWSASLPRGGWARAPKCSPATPVWPGSPPGGLPSCRWPLGDADPLAPDRATLEPPAPPERRRGLRAPHRDRRDRRGGPGPETHRPVDGGDRPADG